MLCFNIDCRVEGSVVKVTKIDSDLFPSLYRAFLHDDDPLSNEQDWRNVFDYQWENEQGHCGYALLDGDTVVGMMGMVFSERTIAGAKHKFCNLHTWWVREDHRGRSLALLRPVLKLKDYSITHFTPCDIIRAVTQKMGFEQLSSQLTILLPKKSKTRRSNETTFDETEILSKLDAPHARILLDHRPYRCGHYLLRSGKRQCYILYSHVIRHRLPYCHIHYVSDQTVFLEHQLQIRQELLQRHKARFNAVDRRLFPTVKFPRSFQFWSPSNAMFKSAGLAEDQIDNLYSDVTMLRLTTLPSIGHELKQVGRSFLGLERQP